MPGSLAHAANDGRGAALTYAFEQQQQISARLVRDVGRVPGGMWRHGELSTGGSLWVVVGAAEVKLEWQCTAESSDSIHGELVMTLGILIAQIVCLQLPLVPFSSCTIPLLHAESFLRLAQVGEI